MCGIFAVLSASPHDFQPSSALQTRLVNRGPDHLGRYEFAPDAKRAWALSFTSTVLALRGSKLVEQPLVDEASGEVLCWNGEAWKIGERAVSRNDGEEVLKGLTASDADPADFLRSIQGPFAFVFFSKARGRLYFGRDRLGRRSLLSCQTGDALRLSSVADEPHEGWQEVEADGFYSIEVRAGFQETMSTLIRHPWVHDEELVSGIGLFNEEVSSAPCPLTQQSHSVEQLHQHLMRSLNCRVLDVPRPPGCHVNGSRIAVLFSGGLDCTVLARLLNDIVPETHSVDLINVAFENPRIRAQQAGADLEKLYEICPDRVTGRKSFAELVSVCPGRRWRFVAVNVPYSETTSNRAEVVKLIYPHQTEMDLSIAYALYFAARGQGMAQETPTATPEPYSTTARVLLSGLGADELFGGYTRHATAFTRGGHAGLAQELKLDVSRLGKRNLGRDDRAMSHWGREVRFPFLDEELVDWAIGLPVWEKCDFENVGDETYPEAPKRVLRLLAQKLGMSEVSLEKKRAIQFGARTAKMESGKTKGTTLITA
ncbi:hypothetical protein NLU13_2032 [Sarocladium strictum]|uniref:Glutamine amidotransferase type-2 domain-containing protein n=1 Tax=Sarocladium strictum TaxID=5046 RepID=A0AA39LCU8_SARSR|nr:hypothetical protein NLU13_2032 [Sarocladium strictum]